MRYKSRFHLVAGCMALLTSLMWRAPVVAAQSGGGRMHVRWPSEEFRTLRSAIAAVDDGGIVEIGPGNHHLGEPVEVHGRRLTFRGAGCDELPREELRGKRAQELKEPGTFTHLLGPRPTGVVAADETVPMFRSVNSRITIDGVKMSGFDAAVLSIPDAENPLGSSVVLLNSCIVHSVRGVLARHQQVTIKGSYFRDLLWTGVSVAPLFQAIGGLPFTLLDTVIANAAYACVVFKNSPGFLGGGMFFGCGSGAGLAAIGAQVWVTNHSFVSQKGPGVLVVNSNAVVTEATFNGNAVAGILAWNSHVRVADTLITESVPVWDFSLQDYVFGDGITALLSDVTLIDNRIHNIYRAGVANFGGYLSLTGNQLWCMGFDIEQENYLGQNFIGDDGGGNKCGCPFPPTGACIAVSAGLAPPPPATPIE